MPSPHADAPEILTLLLCKQLRRLRPNGGRAWRGGCVESPTWKASLAGKVSLERKPIKTGSFSTTWQEAPSQSLDEKRKGTGIATKFVALNAKHSSMACLLFLYWLFYVFPHAFSLPIFCLHALVCGGLQYIYICFFFKSLQWKWNILYQDCQAV